MVELAQWQGIVQQQMGAAERRLGLLLRDVAVAEQSLSRLLVRVGAAEDGLSAERRDREDDRVEWRGRLKTVEDKQKKPTIPEPTASS